MGIWVDNSQADAGTLTVYTCQGGSLSEKIVITGLGTDAAKGTVVNVGSETSDEYGEQSWAEDVEFDLNHTTPGTTFLNVKSVHSNNGDQFKQHINLVLKDEGVSTLRVSRSGEWQGDTFSQMGAAKHNGTYGEVLFANTHNSQQWGNHEYIHRAYFDDNGYIVAASASSAFDSPDGELHVADADVPKQLGSDFTAGTLSESDWDCQTDESITVDMTGANGAAHDACESGRWEWQDCYGNDYAESETEHTIDESAQKDDFEVEEGEESEGE